MAFLLSAAGASAATTIRVTTTSDDGAVAGGDCTTTDQSCSLRQAINTSSAGDTITLPAGDYKLTQEYNLGIEHDLTLVGAGARTTKVQQTTGDYVLAIGPVTVLMKGLTITGGNNVDGFGGGIYNSGGTLTLQDSAVTGNQDAGFDEAYIGGPTSPGLGGGIYSASGGSLTLIRTTVSGNVASPGEPPFPGPYGAGGGIYSTTPVTVINSTIAGNTTQGGSGGGIYMAGGSSPSLTLANATVARNTASAQGGNIYVDTSSGTIPSAVENSIIADGTATAGTENCAGGTLTTDGYNLEDHDQCYLDGATDLHPSDAKLGQLRNNGGPEDTLALLTGSAAINAGNPAGCADPSGTPITSDQRGIPRPQASRCDIGAYEFRTVTLAGRPRISGTPQAGRKLTCRARAVSPDGPAVVIVSWLRGGRNVASGKTYTVRPADGGHVLRCRVVAANSAGSAAGTSKPVSVPPVPTVSITASDVNGHKAKFVFKTRHATGVRCALAEAHKRPHYSSCSSPAIYDGLAKGRYTFFVRAVGPGGTSAPARSSFKIS